jgi:ribosomal-protein-alanine N-acetyltransferase
MTPDALATLHARAFQDSRGWSAEEFEDLLESPFCFLATVDQGFALGREIEGESELLTIAVDPDCRRQGLGASCLAAYEATAKSRGAVTSFLEVADDNAPAKALYLRAGYQETGRRRGYYARKPGNAVDALTMAKELT